MNLNNLSMNYKIVFGISAVTILTLIFKYIKNLLNPNKSLSGDQSDGRGQIINNRYPHDIRQVGNDLNMDLNNLINDDSDNKTHERETLQLLKGLYNEFGEFNHIYKEIMFENLIPSQIKKTIIHLSSINLERTHSNKFSITKLGLKEFNNVINFKLLAAQMPYVPHNIYENSNTLIISGEKIIIKEGYYTIFTLIKTINNELSSRPFCSGMSLSFDNVTKFITLNDKSSSFSETLLSKKLGMTVGSSGCTNKIPDLSTHYIDIIYGDAHPRASALTEDGGTLLKRIPLNGQSGDMIYFNTPESDYHSQELFNPDAGSSISELTFNFKRPDGTEYDFKGLHYDLKIEITELVDPTLLNELTEHRKRDKQIKIYKE